MTKEITRVRMAHALSIIAEAGADGFEYDSAVNAHLAKFYESRKGRWLLARHPRLSPDEFRVVLAYAAQAGFIEAGCNTWELENGSYGVDPWCVHLTLDGHNQLELYDKPLLHRWAKNIGENIPTITISVVTALLSGWAIYYLGPSK